VCCWKGLLENTVPNKLVTEVAMASDEALTHLIVESSWDCWMQDAMTNKGHKVVSRVRPKWTSNAMSTGKYEGWGSEGIPCYNTLCSDVKANRKDNASFQHEYQRVTQEAINTRSSSRLHGATRTAQVVQSYNELDEAGINFVEI
jgi:hypothetical protein